MGRKNGKQVVAIPMGLVDGLGDVASRSEDIVQAIECAYIAVRSDRCDPEAYIDGMLAVLLLAADRMRIQAVSLRDEAEYLLGSGQGRE